MVVVVKSNPNSVYVLSVGGGFAPTLVDLICLVASTSPAHATTAVPSPLVIKADFPVNSPPHNTFHSQK